jgi:lipopolysaccharide heptosyltransferase II
MADKRILIFNVNWLGDVLFSTPTIRNIRRNFPDSFIACIVPSRCYPILKGNPHLDEIIIFDERDRHKSVLAKLRFIRFLKNKRFDIVFLLHRSFSRAFICRLAGIPERIGYSTKKRSFLLTKKITSPPKDSLHRIDYYLNIIEKAGLKIEDRYPEFFISEQDQKFVENFLNKKLRDLPLTLAQARTKDSFLVAINPGGNWLPKRWPKEYWTILADKLISEFGAKVIITGGFDDIKDTAEIKGLMKGKPIVTCGVFNLKQFGALCKKLDLFITADSGPLHIANAVSTKRIIALFGPTKTSITGPYPLKNVVILSKDVGCKIPCYVVGCMDNRCMKAITVDDVIDAIIRKS